MKKTNTFMIIAFLLLGSITANKSHAQMIGELQWQKSLGGTDDEQLTSIIPTADGGYIAAGYTRSNDGDVSGNHGRSDGWVVKLSATGAIQWQKSLGGTDYERLHSIIPTADGGYIAAGYTDSNDGDVSGNHGREDGWVVKLSAMGTIQWQKCYGGTNIDWFSPIIQTADGGYIAAGYTASNDGDVFGNHGGYSDGWVVKLSAMGVLEWQKCLGGTNRDRLHSIIQTVDGGYIAAGYTESNDGDVSGNHGGYSDGWVVKLSAMGVLEWQKSLGGSALEEFDSIIPTAGGDYIAAGYTTSNDGDVSGNHGKSDAWVVKLSAMGVIKSQDCIGGTGTDRFFSIIPIAGGDFIAAGFTWSNDGDVFGNHGKSDAWVMRGSPRVRGFFWQKCLGGTEGEWLYSIIPTTDGGYIAAGRTDSNDGDVSGNHGRSDGWVVKLKEKYIIGIASFPGSPYTLYPTIIDGEDCITIQATDEEMDLPATVTINQLTFPFKTVLTQHIASKDNTCVGVSNLRTGTYILTVTGPKGEVHKTKIVKQ